MRRLLLVVVVVLVNLPVAHQWWTEHRIGRDGVLVSATFVESYSVGGRPFVDYRMPAEVDPDQDVWTARVSESTAVEAERNGSLEVRVVPGDPSLQRPVGAVESSFLLVAALVADALILAGVVFWWRRNRHRLIRVAWVEDDVVGLQVGDRILAAEPTRSRLVGTVLGGGLRLRAESDVMPALPVTEESPLGEGRYLVRGRVVDVGRNRHGGVVDLQLDDGIVVHVQLGECRNRADLRDHGEVTGRFLA